MNEHEREKDVIVTNGSSGGGAGWFIAGIVLLAVIIAGFYFSDEIFDTRSDNVNVSVDVPKPDVNAPAADTPSGEATQPAEENQPAEGN